MKRIVIIGATGSGKTTLGEKLAQAGIPSVDLDEIHWLPGWQERNREEARRMIDEATQKEKWVVSGNYKKLQDIFWPRADTMVWLDYPFLFVFFRLLKRCFLRILDKKPICNGNYESLSLFFSKKSIMLWLFQSYGRRKREFGEMFSHPEQYPHLNFVRLTNEKETEAWLKKVLS